MNALANWLREFADICSGMKPVGQWPGDGAATKLREAADKLDTLTQQQGGEQEAGEAVDLRKALGRVRARANHPGTLEHHPQSFADGLRAACNMLEGMPIAKSMITPRHPADEENPT